MTEVHQPGEWERSEYYAGSAELADESGTVAVEVTLKGHFEPLDGRFHWYGRIAADGALSDRRSGTAVVLTTPHGSAEAKINDVDPWGRFRVSGLGTPPF